MPLGAPPPALPDGRGTIAQDFSSGNTPDRSRGMVKAQPTARRIGDPRNTPNGSRGMVKIQPTARRIGDPRNTPDGSRGMVKIQPTARRTRYSRNTPPDARIVVAEGSGNCGARPLRPETPRRPRSCSTILRQLPCSTAPVIWRSQRLDRESLENSRPAGWPRGCSKNSPAAMPGCTDRAHRLRPVPRALNPNRSL